MKEISYQRIVYIVSLFIMLFGNGAFVSNVLSAYPFAWANYVYLASLFILFTLVLVIVLLLSCYKKTTKVVLIALLVSSSLAAYFMDNFHVVIDSDMIDNALNTNSEEAFDLINTELFGYLILLGILPSYWLYKTPIVYPESLQAAFFSRLKRIAFLLLLSALVIFCFSKFYFSFWRDHKALRYYSNPHYTIYSLAKYLGKSAQTDAAQFKIIGLDATVAASDGPRKLVIFVVGEAARADHFSLNGYGKETNRYLRHEQVVSFQNVWSCGTSTAISVPCLFSVYKRTEFDKQKAETTENVLDVLNHAGVNVIWLDNNSDSKGVAKRISYESYKQQDHNPVCNDECRDEGMLANLQKYIDSKSQGDIFIVLHQMGNHGPAYYRRYPKDFERFTPACKSNQLEECRKEEIGNAYDNAIAYTDYFLSKTIELLKQNSARYETGMIYVSDHGESLGENNIYLHGMPYVFAPESQKRVPLILWFNEQFYKNKIDLTALKNNITREFSHDNIFHSILGLMDIKTSIYDQRMDIFKYKH